MGRHKKIKRRDGQMELPFVYKDKVDELNQNYKELGESLNEALDLGPKRVRVENEYELTQEIAVALKQDIRRSGLSRDQVVDHVNKYLGRTREKAELDPPQSRKPLSLNMLNNYIGKPDQYPLPSYYMFAFQFIFKTFGVSKAILSAVGASVIGNEDAARYALIKIREFKDKATKLEKLIV